MTRWTRLVVPLNGSSLSQKAGLGAASALGRLLADLREHGQARTGAIDQTATASLPSSTTAQLLLDCDSLFLILFRFGLDMLGAVSRVQQAWENIDPNSDCRHTVILDLAGIRPFRWRNGHGIESVIAKMLVGYRGKGYALADDWIIRQSSDAEPTPPQPQLPG